MHFGYQSEKDTDWSEHEAVAGENGEDHSKPESKNLLKLKMLKLSIIKLSFIEKIPCVRPGLNATFLLCRIKYNLIRQ